MKMPWDNVLDVGKMLLGVFVDSPEIKLAKEQGKLALAKAESEAKIKVTVAKADADIIREQNDADAQNNIDLITVKNQRYTFKDDALVYTWLGILICCFLPWTQPYVKEGFSFLEHSTPEWFKYVLYAITISELGLRRMFMVLMDKFPNRNKIN